jgi:competence protein ComGC
MKGWTELRHETSRAFILIELSIVLVIIGLIVRYRATLAKQHQTPEQSIDMVKDAVREQYAIRAGAGRQTRPIR